MKHNNVLPNAHRVKCSGKFIRAELDQAGRKKRRLLARRQKAAKAGVTPVGYLRPVVHMPSRRYNYKVRLGRGFTIQELKAAGISKKVAMSIGIAVDHRRCNRNAESLNLNVERLKTYLSKLVMIPRKKKACKGFCGIPDDTPREKLATMVLKQQKIKEVMPVVQPFVAEAPRAITSEEAAASACDTLTQARKAAKAKKTDEE
ncbi:putative ribosomal protein L13 [Babesia bovis T2Bo]|uniref:Ribosomal protein L13, putative n=1 Tax=Babesia bovis TaxID=5865 RepID=A7AQS9_BABBO|nr:putative ribosomal protein L13 [Babesia bovis T2Bo]EDO06898.1 putative ribosomal protein L13 [Babesia bovis T2Bo]BAN64719.1 ribosomal protein L13, putative [Babesia bovis]|eukprot:XP_001610466.1 ribosomal protein L13 [Babesia bovis T2Bo]